MSRYRTHLKYYFEVEEALEYRVRLIQGMYLAPRQSTTTIRGQVAVHIRPSNPAPHTHIHTRTQSPPRVQWLEPYLVLLQKIPQHDGKRAFSVYQGLLV